MSSGASEANVPILQAEGLRKQYPGVLAVADAAITVEKGQVLGLVGQNGAGKSTLIKLLSGTEQPDAGHFTVDGTRVEGSWTAKDVHGLGFAFVYQELVDFPDMSVGENLALPYGLPKRGGLFSRRALSRRARETLDKLQIQVDPNARMGDLSIVQRRMVLIASALYREARMVVLDEPTASLGDQEVQHLHRAIKTISGYGVATIYVSHRLEEILELSDRTTVMRDGRTIATAVTGEIDHAWLLKGITGADRVRRDALRPTPPPSDGDGEILRVEGLGRRGAVDDVSFSLARGEVLGFAGLVGSGRTELARLVSGADRSTSGEVFVKGERVKLRSPADAVRRGIVMLPEDRRHQGVISGFGIRQNVTIAALDRFRTFDPLPIPSRSRESAATREIMKRLDVRAPGVDKPVTQLSGGNQQKVILGRWLMHGADILIFDEPTQGIDAGAKEEIFDEITSLAGEGKAAIFISSDLKEIVRVCTRVLVLREGSVAGSFSLPDIAEEDILHACYGQPIN